MPLSSFSPRVRAWFERAFAAPTPAQAKAWPAIARGEHVLLSAPTGSGKTLAACLWALDRLSAADPADGTGDVGDGPVGGSERVAGSGASGADGAAGAAAAEGPRLPRVVYFRTLS